MDRRIIRRNALEARDRLSVAERRRKSRMIMANLLTVPEIIKARTVFLYASFRSEVETFELMDHFLERGCEVAVPLSLVAEKRLAVYRLADPQTDLHPGYCSIPEPDPRTAETIDPAAIDVVLLPGAAFDPAGGRLGYGGGYYDRFLAANALTATRIGLAFKIQVVAELPLLPHDQPLHWLVTEDGARKTGSKL